MTLGRKGLTSGEIKGLTVCFVCFTMCAVCCVLFYLGDMLLCISLMSREIQSNMSRSLPYQLCRRSLSAGQESPAGTW
ncbi:unnamed protein product [Staurois parvus]|uniref:Uncharacterized protein n=1 Tax=Staurois parvus TaxID=386267 RepID=A0ABN9HWN1_9NEOB|nr:unnamed protein product [Staurois parvus]